MLSGARYVQKQAGVLIVSLGPVKNRQERMALANDLDDLAASLLLDDEVHVVVLVESDTEAFRIEEGAAAPEGEECAVSESMGGSLAGPVAALEVPVIAAMTGDALGQGLELALACDVRIAAETSRFGLPQIMQGCLPNDGGTQRLVRLVGKGKALEMILTGQTIDAQEALRIGLVNRILPREEVTAAALALACEMAAKAPISLRYAKEAILEGTEMTLDQGLRLEGDLYLLLQTTRDRDEGIGAFHRKEEPRFEGR
jgi:enoyl-CoA hydratase